MTTTDWIIDITLVLLVLRQLREARIDRRFVAIPVALVGYTAYSYLGTIPTAGPDLVLIGACLAVGTALGVAGGFATHVRAADGQGHARAGLVAAGLWVASMGARLGFIVWITHSAGEASLARFSMAHHITGGDVWQDALVLLALSEVVVRLAIIVARSEVATRSTTQPTQRVVTV